MLHEVRALSRGEAFTLIDRGCLVLQLTLSIGIRAIHSSKCLASAAWINTDNQCSGR
jgi:hypothetical protein